MFGVGDENIFLGCYVVLSVLIFGLSTNKPFLSIIQNFDLFRKNLFVVRDWHTKLRNKNKRKALPSSDTTGSKLRGAVRTERENERKQALKEQTEGAYTFLLKTDKVKLRKGQIATIQCKDTSLLDTMFEGACGHNDRFIHQVRLGGKMLTSDTIYPIYDYDKADEHSLIGRLRDICEKSKYPNKDDNAVILICTYRIDTLRQSREIVEIIEYLSNNGKIILFFTNEYNTRLLKADLYINMKKNGKIKYTQGNPYHYPQNTLLEAYRLEKERVFGSIKPQHYGINIIWTCITILTIFWFWYGTNDMFPIDIWITERAKLDIVVFFIMLGGAWTALPVLYLHNDYTDTKPSTRSVFALYLSEFQLSLLICLLESFFLALALSYLMFQSFTFLFLARTSFFITIALLASSSFVFFIQLIKRHFPYRTNVNLLESSIIIFVYFLVSLFVMRLFITIQSIVQDGFISLFSDIEPNRLSLMKLGHGATLSGIYALTWLGMVSVDLLLIWIRYRRQLENMNESNSKRLPVEGSGLSFPFKHYYSDKSLNAEDYDLFIRLYNRNAINVSGTLRIKVILYIDDKNKSFKSELEKSVNSFKQELTRYLLEGCLHMNNDLITIHSTYVRDNGAFREYIKGEIFIVWTPADYLNTSVVSLHKEHQ